MEKKLHALFDFQRFQKDPSLQALIDETMDRCSRRSLSDDDLELVAAAGTPEWMPRKEKPEDI